MIQDIATVFWRDWIVLRHRLLKFMALSQQMVDF